MRFRAALIWLLSGALVCCAVLRGAPTVDPFAFLRPSVVVNVDERRQLDRGESFARILPAVDRDVAIFAAVAVMADGDRLVTWVRDIAELKKSPYVLEIARFSDPPRLEDLGNLTLDAGDLLEIRTCHPGDCSVKLAGVEMDALRRAAGESSSDWKPAVQAAFRRIVLQRVQAYRAKGHAGLPGYEDRGGPPSASLEAKFASVVEHSAFMRQGAPEFAEYLRRFPAAAPMLGAESFIYWSKERLGGKSIISATHVTILRGGSDSRLPDALVAGKQIFATHYMNGSLTVTLLLRGDSGSRNYLAYVDRFDVDLVGGPMGGIARWFMQRRLKDEASNVLLGLRRRLESGEPGPRQRR